MNAIFLIGFMGCGKSTLGRALEAATGLRLIDLDEWIEQREGCSVSRLFEERSEAGFREIERDALAEVSRMENVIVACGGGTPCFFNNMEVMNRAGLSVWLDASVGRLHERLALAREKRPLIAQMADDELQGYIGRALDARRPFYSQASARFCADRLDDERQIAESVEEFRRRFLGDTICRGEK